MERGTGVNGTALVVTPRAPLGWERLRKLVVDSVLSVHSRRAYAHAIDHFFSWYRDADRGPFSKALVQETGVVSRLRVLRLRLSMSGSLPFGSSLPKRPTMD